MAPFAACRGEIIAKPSPPVTGEMPAPGNEPASGLPEGVQATVQETIDVNLDLNIFHLGYDSSRLEFILNKLTGEGAASS